MPLQPVTSLRVLPGLLQSVALLNCTDKHVCGHMNVIKWSHDLEPIVFNEKITLHSGIWSLRWLIIMQCLLQPIWLSSIHTIGLPLVVATYWESMYNTTWSLKGKHLTFWEEYLEGDLGWYSWAAYHFWLEIAHIFYSLSLSDSHTRMCCVNFCFKSKNPHIIRACPASPHKVRVWMLSWHGN